MRNGMPRPSVISFDPEIGSKSRQNTMVPATNPNIIVEKATLSFPFDVRIPMTNTLATGGDNMDSTMDTASKILSNRPINGDQDMASKITTRLAIRPVLSTILSGVDGRILFTMSKDTRVPTEFNPADIVLIRAASKAAVISPMRPLGSTFEIRTISVSLGSTI